MKKLFLASWFAETACLLSNFMKEDLNGKKCIFIPTAGLHEMSDEDREGLDLFNQADKEALQNLGLVVEELEVSQEPYEVIEKAVSSADCIFVCGGSTLFLLQALKRKSADKLIRNHIEAGKLYIGSSAGSILMQTHVVSDNSENPEYAPELNGDFSGLGYIDFCLYVHYGGNYWGNDDESIAKYYAKLNCKTLSDKQAVTVDGDKIEIVTSP